MMNLDEHRDIDDDVNPITGDLDVEFSTSDVNLTSLDEFHDLPTPPKMATPPLLPNPF